MMRFLLLVNYDNGGVITEPMLSWDPADIRAHLAYYETLNAELRESGELVGGEALAWPESAKVVRSDGRSAPVVTDGPYAEAKEQLAGFQVIEVESIERALEIAARVSAVPGPGGVPLQQPIEVRQVMDEDGLDTAEDAVQEALIAAAR
jgi:hypothetical protein